MSFSVPPFSFLPPPVILLENIVAITVLDYKIYLLFLLISALNAGFSFLQALDIGFSLLDSNIMHHARGCFDSTRTWR